MRKEKLTLTRAASLREEIEEKRTIRFLVKGITLFKATSPKMGSVHRMATCNRQGKSSLINRYGKHWVR